MKYLADWLKFKGVSAYRLQKTTGIKPTQLYGYVHDREKNPPRAPTQRKIANALGINEEDLQRSPDWINPNKCLNKSL